LRRIRWKGFGRRTALGYEWPETGAVVDGVSDEDAQILLRQAEQFEELDAPGDASATDEVVSQEVN
jgi:hypothetical protein